MGAKDISMGAKAGIAVLFLSLAGLVLLVQALNLFRHQESTRIENIAQDFPPSYNYNYTTLDWQTQNINVNQNRSVDYSVYSYIVSKHNAINGNGNSNNRTGFRKETRLANLALPRQPGPGPEAKPASLLLDINATVITYSSPEANLPLSHEPKFNSSSFNVADTLVPQIQIHDCVVLYLKGIHSHLLTTL